MMVKFFQGIALFILLVLMLIGVSAGGSVQMNPLFICKGFFTMFVAIWTFYGLGTIWANYDTDIFKHPLIIASFLCLVTGIGMWLYLLGAAGGGS